MCGIFSIISRDSPVIDHVVSGLIRLQNRGRDSTGFITASSETQNFEKVVRGKGPASKVLQRINLEEITGNVAIGHNRYPTTGEGSERQIQPMYCARPGIAIAHNGQLANHFELADQLPNYQ